MENTRIAELLSAYMGSEGLAPSQLDQLAKYLDLLLKWNARMNLTAVRDPEQIVTRHFGESLFTAKHLFPDPGASSDLTDVGSGAGFPGLPIAIARRSIEVVLLEAHGKKATFLKEAVRTLELRNVRVVSERAEAYQGLTSVVTLRAVEDFAGILPIAARIVAPGGRLACLVGESQVAEGKQLLGNGWEAEQPVYYVGSTQRALWISRRTQNESPGQSANPL